MLTKRRLALLLCAAFAAVLWAVCLPTAALAENEELAIHEGDISIGSTTIAGEAGWIATQGSNVKKGTYADTLRISGDLSETMHGVSISGVGSDAAPMLIELSYVRIKATGTPFDLDFRMASNVTLTVLNDCTIQKNDNGRGSAIKVPSPSTLTVKGPGKLTVKASNDNTNDADAQGAAFGGELNCPCGNIIFDGAYVEAYAECGAAIGGSSADDGGTVLVKGGSRVTATSIYGAAIGGGGGVPGTVACKGGNGGTLTIESGTVIASSTYGAAVGGGAGVEGGSGGGGGTLIMRGGILKATSTNAAAIGGGYAVTMGSMGAAGTVDLTGYSYQWSTADADASYQPLRLQTTTARAFEAFAPQARRLLRQRARPSISARSSRALRLRQRQWS